VTSTTDLRPEAVLDRTGTRADGRARALLLTIALGAGFLLVQALAARLRILIPGSPVPITLQTLPVLLSGAFLGSRGGAATQLAYLGVGAAGAPVFTGGAGFLYLFGPTGGYLFGFVAAAWVVGRLVESGAARTFAGAFASLLFGSFVILLMGSLYLGLFFGGDFARGLLLGGAVFLAGDVVKVAAAASIYRAIRR